MTRAKWPFGGGKPTYPRPVRPPEPVEPLGGFGPAIAELSKLNADEKRYGVDIALAMHKARRTTRKP